MRCRLLQQLPSRGEILSTLCSFYKRKACMPVFFVDDVAWCRSGSVSRILSTLAGCVVIFLMPHAACPAFIAGCNYYPGILSGQATLPLFVLHRAGFTMPPSLPSERWALTPPFHPYPCGRFVFCGTFRPPGIGSGCLPFSEDTLPYDVRTFLYAANESTATTRTRTASSTLPHLARFGKPNFPRSVSKRLTMQRLDPVTA